MTHHGFQEQNTTSHLVNAFMKCTKKGGLTRIKIPVLLGKKITHSFFSVKPRVKFSLSQTIRP